MRTFLDADACPIDATTVPEALAELAQRAERAGRIVVEVHLDGRPLAEDDLDALDDRTPLPSELRVTTTTPAELLGATFEQSAEAVDEASAAQRACAELLQSGRRTEALAELESALGLWTQVNTAVERGMRLAGWDPDAVDLGDASLPEALNDLAARLREIREAARLRDDVRLADCLLYDMPATADRWTRVLPALARLARTHMRS